MQINFKALEQALAPIAEIGQGELTFDAGGTPITLRVLRPWEEVEAQKYASTALESADDNNAAVDYLDRFRLGCLSHAIVAVGSTDFRQVDYVETGDTTENGVPIKVQKHKAMRDLLSRWTRSAISGVFMKFNELVQKTEIEAERAIEYEPANIPAEIDRLHQRIEELRAEQTKQEATEKSRFSAMVAEAEAQVVANATQARSQAPEPDPTPEPEAPEPQPVPAQAPRRTGAIIPQAAPPPERVVVPPTAQPQAAAPQRPQAPPVPPRPDSSFINAEDDASMNAAMMAEHQRLLEMRRRQMQGQPPMDEASALEKVHPQLQPPRRRPPHLDAAETEEDLGLLEARAQQARHLGETPDGVPVFALPAQDLEVAGNRPRPNKAALDPKTESGGSRNPRFQPPRRP